MPICIRGTVIGVVQMINKKTNDLSRYPGKVNLNALGVIGTFAYVFHFDVVK